MLPTVEMVVERWMTFPDLTTIYRDNLPTQYSHTEVPHVRSRRNRSIDFRYLAGFNENPKLREKVHPNIRVLLRN
jgi:hypothetical protein